ncbi:MAG: hypothetical protein ACOYKE_02590 [Ferruginibacter sp.]
MKSFIGKNRVMIGAVLSALLLVLQQFTGVSAIDWKAIGFAALIAVLGVFANSWKGKGITLVGIVGSVSNAFVVVYQTGVFSWNTFILSATIALLSAFIESLKAYDNAQV